MMKNIYAYSLILIGSFLIHIESAQACGMPSENETPTEQIEDAPLTAFSNKNDLLSDQKKDSSTWNGDYWPRIQSVFSKIAHSSQWELLVPVNTWHNRLTYDHSKIKTYNERPWGAGIAKSYYDDFHQVRHSLFLMEFQDSHDDVEPFAGYSWQKLWSINHSENWRASLGFAAGITLRSDYDYVPLPAILPVFGIEYKKLSIESTYIPGFTKNSGNVLFTWLRWRF